MKLLVSIIIPAYNCENYVEETINSCLQQTYKNLEIVIVNDGSTDKTEELILSFKDTRIKYYKIKNSGPCYARNFGIAKATGILFQFLDGDDVLDHNKLELQVKNYEAYGDDYVYTGVMGMIMGNQRKLEADYDFYYRNLGVEEYFKEMFNHFGKYLTTGIWLIPRTLIEKTHGWDERVRINNDGEYFTRIILCSAGLIFCPEAIFYYRRDVPMSVSKQLSIKSKDIYESWLYSYSCYVKYFLRTFNPKTAKELGRKALSVYYCNSYPHYPELLAECKSQLWNLGYRSPSPHGGKAFKLLSKLIGVGNALRLRTLKDSKFSR